MHANSASSNHGTAPEVCADVAGLSIGGDFHGLRLVTAFQPIFSMAQRRPVGYEALLRGCTRDDREVPPAEIFAESRQEPESSVLEGLACRTHLSNFIAQRPPNSWLFVNVSPSAFVREPRDAGGVLRLTSSSGLTPYRVVIEVVESAIDDERALADAMQFFRRQGCLIALDDFGTGHSNFGRVWTLEPDIVKLDQRLTRRAVESRKTRRMLVNIVNMLHESGSLVVLEGVESEDDAMLAIDIDVDMAQGFLFGRPSTIIPGRNSYPIVPADLCRKHREQYQPGDAERRRRRLIQPIHAFLDSARALEAGQAMESACFRLLRQEGVECSYLLNGDGVQTGQCLLSAGGVKVCDPRYAPLFDTAGANWFRRPYFQSAMHNPGHVQISTPYLSLAGAYLCVTLSIAIHVDGGLHVFCCDVNWDRLVCREN
jgi:EAL domain-containing protein (putative c-di-GMP-specific phosphodiesterase class I)